MPNKQFLEEYALYRKFPMSVPISSGNLSKTPVKMECLPCKTTQTFTLSSTYEEWAYGRSGPHRADYETAGYIATIVYRCSHCQEFNRTFLVLFDTEHKWVMKVGQYPAWDTKGDAQLEQFLDKSAKYSSLFRRGLICESQGYGIGAFGYYRRIVEVVIDDFLAEIPGLLSGPELAAYEDALAQTQRTRVTQEKIALVKDLLPPLLRPEGQNPLGILHSALSEGLHAGTDEQCLSLAAILRGVLLYLVHQVTTHKEASKTFTEGMKKLLEKKAGK